MSTTLTRTGRRRIRTRERGNFLAGCLIVLGIILVLAIAGGVFVYMNWRDWAGDFGAAGLTAAVQEMDLPQDQELAVIAEIEALRDDFKAERVSLQEIGRVAEAFAESPALYVMAASAIRANYIEPSGLTEEEKANADLQLSRLARGLSEKLITTEEAQNAMDQIIVQTGEDQFELREPDVVTDEDLRELVDKVTALADEKGIPEERFEVDVAAEVRKTIDKALGRTPAEPDPSEAPVTPEPPADPGAADPGEPDPGDPGEGGGGGG